MDVGNSAYYLTRATEYLSHAKEHKLGTVGWHENIKEAITLLILARASEPLE